MGLWVCAKNVTHRGISVGSQGDAAKDRDVLLCVCREDRFATKIFNTFFQL